MERAMTYHGLRSNESDAGVSRRRFLKAVAVAGAGAALPASGLLAQGGSGGSRAGLRPIDAPHPMSPPFYVKAMAQETGGAINTRNWTPKSSLDMMDKAGVETSMVSP